MTALSSSLRRFADLTGAVTAWLTLPMVFVTFVIVVLRYAFDLGWIWLQESVIWLHAVVFMLAAAYTLNRDEHVRVDIFYRSMSPRRKAWVNLLGTVLFLAPVSIFLIATSFEYVADSWANHERSREAGGLPFPFVPLLKTVIPLSFVFVLLQGVAEATASALALSARGGDRDARAP